MFEPILLTIRLRGLTRSSLNANLSPNHILRCIAILYRRCSRWFRIYWRLRIGTRCINCGLAILKGLGILGFSDPIRLIFPVGRGFRHYVRKKLKIVNTADRVCSNAVSDKLRRLTGGNTEVFILDIPPGLFLSLYNIHRLLRKVPYEHFLRA